MNPKGLPAIRVICGTGRSGSWAWYRIMQAQGADASHESLPFPWKQDPCTFYYLMCQCMVSWNGSPIWSNSSFVWIQYIGLLMKTFKDPRVLCIRRPKDAMVASFMKHWPEENFWTDMESVHWDHQYPQLNIFAPNKDRLLELFPKYDLPKEDAIARYYDEYYEMAEFWQHRLPNNFMIVSLHDAMNTVSGQRKIFEFFGIDNPQLYVGVRLNASGEHRGLIYKERQGVHGPERIYEEPAALGQEARLSLQSGSGEICRDVSESLWRPDPAVSGGD